MVFTKKILLLYKKSSYKIYCLERKSSFYLKKTVGAQQQLQRFTKAHDEHYLALDSIEAVLKAYGIQYDKVCRGRKVDYQKYNFIITVGGDGTFLEASRKVTNQIMLGVNSSLSYSVGYLCAAHISNFEKIINSILKKKSKVERLHRLRLDISEEKDPVFVLNDILVCHKHPASMSRYRLKIGRVEEEQRNSGVWISTASGSSGAIYSAGGRVIKRTDKKMQYKPRELYYSKHHTYKLTGGFCAARQSIQMVSLMREGKIFVDGAHLSIPFSFGSVLKASLSAPPIKTIGRCLK